MTSEDINNIISTICPNDADFEKPIISPAYLKKELEALALEQEPSGMTNRLKIGQEVLIHGYIDEIRKDTIIIQNEGGYFGTVEYEVTDIENTKDVLDEIAKEIALFKDYPTRTAEEKSALRVALQIIDKYRK